MNLTQLPAWKALEDHYKAINSCQFTANSLIRMLVDLIDSRSLWAICCLTTPKT